MNALLEGDRKQCLLIVRKLIDEEVSIKEIYMQLFQRSMYRIGQMWEKERCTIADEHVATKITEGLIDYVSTFFDNTEKSGSLALITCIDKEFHELGARMVAGYFEANGWDTIFAGSNTPEQEVIQLIREKKPDLVGISSSFYINVNRLIKLIETIKMNFPSQEILVGGQSLAEERSNILSAYGNVHYITCLNGLEKYLSSYSKR
ncbi:MAG: cobalamin-binding protein [Ignavibacteriae bacterium HGW-Ignavibacteriae-3]|nr:MAG: cobalamin-binding protein [Ignavibacteriae bacterium HGW-Ignavibacteriae-3]